MNIEMISNSFWLAYGVRYSQPGKALASYIEYNFRHTTHSFQRAAQRGLDNRKISAILEYGETYSRQGLTYYVLGEHNTPSHLKKELEKIKNSVVVLASDSGVVLTCYRTANGHKHIKSKQKNIRAVRFPGDKAAA
jgi:hypothetical protein